MTPIGLAVLELLQQKQIAYQKIHHEAAQTCEQSAAQRGMPMEIGGKSLLFKAKQGFVMFVLPANAQLDSNKVRKHLHSQKLRFASPDELMSLAGVDKGALPPFGSGLLDIPMYLDQSLKTNTQLAFNCGVNTVSIILAMDDYLSLVEAQWCDCVKS